MRNHCWYNSGWSMRNVYNQDQCIDCGLCFYIFFDEYCSELFKQLRIYKKAYFKWPKGGWFTTKDLPACRGKTNWKSPQDF